MAGVEIKNQILAKLDAGVTIVRRYHSEEEDLPPRFGNDLKIKLHYRPSGVIGHIKNKEGKFLHRLEANSGSELRKALEIDPS